VSFPNIATITVRVSLFMGRFDYAIRGILGGHHVRFYTRKSARKFLEENGYRIVKEHPTVMPVELVLGLDPNHPLMRAANAMLRAATLFSPGLFAYQFVFSARPRT
jgi:hypothetical protein